MKKSLENNVWVDEETGCWEWQGSWEPRGYPVIWIPGKGRRYAHRLSYEVFNNVKLETSTRVFRSCNNHCCINPDHLVTGKNRRTLFPVKICSHGHNKVQNKNGHWVCNKCTGIKAKVWREANREQVNKTERERQERKRNGQREIRGIPQSTDKEKGQRLLGMVGNLGEK